MNFYVDLMGRASFHVRKDFTFVGKDPTIYSLYKKFLLEDIKIRKKRLLWYQLFVAILYVSIRIKQSFFNILQIAK